MELLKVNKLTKTYEEQDMPAVDDVSFTLKKGEIFGLIGESGSGKTSLMQLIAGNLDPDSGEVYFKDKKVTGPSVNLLPGHPDISLVKQDFDLFPNLTVKENIAYFIKHWKKELQGPRIDSLLSLCNLEKAATKKPMQLSGGEKQRIALVRALAGEPDLLLLDEPFSHLDPALKHRLMGEVQNIINETGTTAIFITHDTRDGLAIASSLAAMQKGKFVQTGTPRQIYDNPQSVYVASLFGVPNILPVKFATEVLNAKVSQKATHCHFREENVVVVSAEDIQTVSGSIHRTIYQGDHILLEIRVGEWTVFSKAYPGSDWQSGQSVGVRINPWEVVFLYS